MMLILMNPEVSNDKFNSTCSMISSGDGFRSFWALKLNIIFKDSVLYSFMKKYFSW